MCMSMYVCMHAYIYTILPAYFSLTWKDPADMRKAGMLDAPKERDRVCGRGLPVPKRRYGCTNRNHDGRMPRSDTQLESSRPIRRY